MKNRIALVQEIIPHYRNFFFKKLLENWDLDLYLYRDKKDQTFLHSDIPTTNIKSLIFGRIVIYNPWKLIKNDYKILILMFNFGHLTTWVLLFTKFIHKKKIFLWGHGISVKRYLLEEIHPDWKLKLMIHLADGVWVYTEREKNLWKRLTPKKKIVSLNNTIESCASNEKISKKVLKEKYNITQDRILIFCARFENIHRRTDILLEVIKKVKRDKIGFIIIGEGSLKPDFSEYENVYDFGKVYNNTIKNDLFGIADIYFQPGWVGLSIVEAMTYSLPIFTFKRTSEILQCVEYTYIEEDYNGRVFSNVDEAVYTINTISNNDIEKLSSGSRDYYLKNLKPELMVNNALSSINN